MSKDYGAIVTQAGAPVRFADDYQRVLDTRWRPLAEVIAYPVDFVAVNGYAVTKIFDHNLGYVPVMDAPRQTDRLSPQSQSNPLGANFFITDSNAVYFVTRPISYTVRVKGIIYLYDIPINETFDSEYKGVSLATTAKSNYGLKIKGNTSYTNASLTSGDNLGFSVNTNNKQLSIAKIDKVVFTNDPSGVDVLTINHNIPYPPLIKIARKVTKYSVQTGTSTYLDIPDESYTNISLSDLNILANAGSMYKITAYVSLTPGVQTTFAYVILRDPSEIAG